MVNCKGTFTIISGSQSLPEVKRAMDEASRYYVHLDELMEGVGKRLAALTGAEWGIVTAGCAAAMTHATSACLAGGNPEKMQRLPNLRACAPKSSFLAYSRNEYDHAIRMLGVKIVEVNDPAKLDSAFTDRLPWPTFWPARAMTARSAPGRLRSGARKGVPVLVDAAAEILTIPNVHLQRGATMVAYSGGKCLRGPQCAGHSPGRQEPATERPGSTARRTMLSDDPEGRQGRDHGHADRCRDVDQARSQTRVGPVGIVAESHFGEGQVRGRGHDASPTAGQSLQSCPGAADRMGWRAGSESRDRK